MSNDLFIGVALGFVLGCIFMAIVAFSMYPKSTT